MNMLKGILITLFLYAAIGTRNLAEAAEKTKEELELEAKNVQLVIKELKELQATGKWKYSIKPRMDPIFVTKFFRNSKEIVKTTVENIQKYYKNISERIDMFKDGNSDDPDLVKVYDMKMARRLSKVVEEGPAKGATVIVVKASNWNYKEVDVDRMVLANFFVAEEVSALPSVQSDGIIQITDASGMDLTLAKKLMSNKSLLVDCGNEMFPSNLHGIYVVNLPSILTMTVKPFLWALPSSLFGGAKINFVTLDELHKLIPKKHLPGFLGGDIEDEDKAFDTTITDALKAKETKKFYPDYYTAMV